MVSPLIQTPETEFNPDFLSEENLNSLPQNLSDPDLNDSNFDLTKYVTEPQESEPKKPDPLIRFGGKKLDLKAQCYVTELNNDEEENDHVDVETVSENGSPAVLEAGDVDSLLEQFEATEGLPIAEKTEEIEEKANVRNVETSQVEESIVTDNVKSKQILEALPEELIKRIKESGKRKKISVIPAIPNKKRCANRIETKNKISKVVSTEAVFLDHDYCSSPSPYPKHPKKDSGFGSAEEDERMILMNQPTVKNADGTLMVSLLKANTIKTNVEVKQKKKLNLAEYKQRKNINVNDVNKPEAKVENSAENNNEEDENIKRQKHQEKLMKMAKELLNTPAKSSKPDFVPKTKTKPEAPKIITVKPTKPPDMDVKTIVSMGVNTDISTAPVVEEIKPLLQNAKIGTNSLITAVIENIPKVATKSLVNEKPTAKGEHGENKTIVYLPKDRVKAITCDVGVQTESERSRRPCSRGSSYERRERYRKRSSSRSSSRYSSSGSYSSCSSSSST